MEASGLSGCPVIPKFKFARSFMAGDGRTYDTKKMAFVPHKEEQKENQSMDPMVESSWEPTNYLALVEESISLVGKSTNMPSTTLGDVAPHTTGVGKMKLEAPP